MTVLAIRAGRICDVWFRQRYFGWPSSFLKFSRSSASKISRVCSKILAYCGTTSITFVIAHMLVKSFGRVSGERIHTQSI